MGMEIAPAEGSMGRGNGIPNSRLTFERTVSKLTTPITRNARTVLRRGIQISFSVRYYMIGKSPKTWQLPIYFPACTGSLKYGTGLGYKPLFCISN